MPLSIICCNRSVFMKQELKKRIIIILFVLFIGCFSGFCIVQYIKQKEEKIERETLAAAEYFLLASTYTSSLNLTVETIIQIELQDHYQPIDSAAEILKDFVDHDLIDPLKYIIELDNYTKYKPIFEPIRKIIAKLAYFDHDFFEILEGETTRVRYIDKNTFYYQSKKNVLTKDNWTTLFENYKKKKFIKDSYFIDALWSHPTARAILQSKGIQKPIENEQFLKIYKESYKELEPYVLEILTDIVPDFCNFVLETEQYKMVDFDTVLLTYEIRRRAYMEDSGYYDGAIDMKKFFKILEENNYPKLYF